MKGHHARHDGQLQRGADQHQADDLGAEHDDEGDVHESGQREGDMGPVADHHPDGFAAAVEQNAHGDDVQKLDAHLGDVGGDGGQRFHKPCSPQVI